MNQNKEVLFCWVPSHCGIVGNEAADQAAKEALSKTLSPIMIPFTDKIPSINNYIKKCWQWDWDRAVTNKLHTIKPHLGPSYVVHTSRKDQVILNRVRIGHSRLTHSFLMERKPIPTCPFCNRNKFLTMYHVIIDCATFNSIRLKYFNVLTLKDLFDHVSAKNIIGYLKETYLYRYL